MLIRRFWSSIPHFNHNPPLPTKNPTNPFLIFNKFNLGPEFSPLFLVMESLHYMIRRLENAAGGRGVDFHPPIVSWRSSTLETIMNKIMNKSQRPAVVPIPNVETADRAELYRALEASLGNPFNSEPLAPKPEPLITVISGPSGVGKDSVIQRLREVRENIHFVVTATSRPMRPGEVDGKDYFFMSKEEFLGMIEKDEFLEYALVYGDYKGIPKQQIRDHMAKGHDIVLRVDIQGAATLRKILGDSAVFVFLVAESESDLVMRLIGRKTESKEALLVRVAMAKEELKQVKNFDYVVVNATGKLESCVKTLESIIDAEKARVKQRRAVI